MMQKRFAEEIKATAPKPVPREPVQQHANPSMAASPLKRLQQQIGNRAVQRLLAQHRDEGPWELDDETTGRIESARGGGHPLEDVVKEKMGAAIGADFGGVNVHTSREADALNRQLSATAFTTGQDIFFREGAYQPHSGSGQELLAHELTHVVQQSSGAVDSGGRMTVNAPGDAFEQEADAVAKAVTSGAVQMEAEGEGEELLA